ncbi:MAG: DNA ligase D [Pseudomonadota bacterium]
MRIATYNVNGITTRLPQLLAWLARESPDVVCLQELKADNTGFPRGALNKAGYGAIWHGQRSWNGVAILTKGAVPEEMRRGLPGNPSDDHSRYLEADINGILVACIYLPNGNPQPGPKFDYKLAWFERLIRHAMRLWKSGVPTVLAGDFNVVPTDFDIYSPKSWKKDALLQPESRIAYARLLQQGWTDALRECHPGEAIYTFWDYFRDHWNRNAGLRIDHLLLSQKLKPRLVDANVDRWVRGEPHPSDHAPVWIELSDGKSNPAQKRKGVRKMDMPDTLAKRSAPVTPAKSKTKHARSKPTPRREKSAVAATTPAGAIKKAAPSTLKPVLATLVDRPPAQPAEWIYEVKFDGYRMLARVEAKRVRLITRNGHDWTDKLPHLREALESMSLKPGWLDGEVVMLKEHGATSFQELQNAFDSARTRDIVYFLFDVPYYNGYDLTQVPLEQRRRLLQSLVENAPAAVRFSDAFEAAPNNLVTSACKLGLEGIIGKRRDSSYSSRRSPDWIKLKCAHRQEFVVGGWTDPKGSRSGLGSLLLGVHDADGKLVYAGKVGSGFNESSLAQISGKLAKLAATKSPFKSRIPESAVHWVKPTLVAEVTFSEWTGDGHLRHPVFHALRTDKPAKTIIKEDPVAPLGPDAEESPPIPAQLRVSHPDRVVDATSGITKIEIIRYYAQVGELMMEHLQDRPVSLVKAPQGIGKPMFFQKHAENHQMDGVEQVDRKLDPDHPPYLVIASARGLLSAAQMNVIEFHTWNVVKPAFQKPDRMIFDLDPGQGTPWSDVLQGAELMHSFLKQLDLPAFLKTSGGKGLHVVTPITPQFDWDTVKDFSQAIVVHMAATLPKLFVAKSGPRNRIGKVFIDYLRNGFGATTASAWSARARPGMGISVPIAWSDLPKLTGAAHWTIQNVQPRLGEGNKPWSNYSKSVKSLKAAMEALEFRPKKTERDSE